MSRVSLLWSREIGDCRPSSLQRAETEQRVYDYQLSDDCQVQGVQNGGINSLHLDPEDSRYLLSGSADKLITIFDTWNRTGKTPYTIKHIAVIGRPNHIKFAHKYSVSCVQWYQHDNAIFTTSSTDQTVKIWDSNALRPAETFQYKYIINMHAMSTVATKHNMIAVATSDNAVYIADMRTGSNSHIMRGHRKAVLTVRWSPLNEYELVSGSEDNRILLWDVRQARDHLISFDQHNGKDTSTKKGTTAHNGHVNGLCFSKDGLFLISTGTDSRLRLWNAFTGENTLTNYGRIENDFRRPIHPSITTDGGAVFVPTNRNVSILNVMEGNTIKKLSAHFNSPTCCEFNPFNQEMYSGGQDNNILVWGPPAPQKGDLPNDERLAILKTTTSNPAIQQADLTADTWSDDEND